MKTRMKPTPTHASVGCACQSWLNLPIMAATIKWDAAFMTLPKRRGGLRPTRSRMKNAEQVATIWETLSTPLIVTRIS
jgi:hypothetical protein